MNIQLGSRLHKLCWFWWYWRGEEKFIPTTPLDFCAFVERCIHSILSIVGALLLTGCTVAFEVWLNYYLFTNPHGPAVWLFVHSIAGAAYVGYLQENEEWRRYACLVTFVARYERTKDRLLAGPRWLKKKLCFTVTFDLPKPPDSPST